MLLEQVNHPHLVKSKGLISNNFRKLCPEYAGKGNAYMWYCFRIAYKMHKICKSPYKRSFAVFGLPTHIRSDGQAALTR